MINDNIKNAAKYSVLGDDFKKAIEFLAKITPETEKGVYNISETASVNVGDNKTRLRADGLFESHDKYVDIHFIVKGVELVDVYDADKLTITEDKLEKGDFCFLTDTDDYSTAYLNEGDFVVVFPKEAHKPLIAANDTPSEIIKAIVKIKFN